MANLYDNSPKPSILNGEINKTRSDLEPIVHPELKSEAAKNTASAKRLLQFNNSSYSGVDIKVLVHKYETPTQDLRADVDFAISVYSQVKVIMLDLATSIIPLIGASGTLLKEGAGSQAAYAQTLNSYLGAINKITKLENDLSGTGFIQFIGVELAALFIEAQQDPPFVSARILSQIDSLDNLISGWQRQAKSLQARDSEISTTKVLAELQTISINTFREKVAVRACGNVGVKGYARGPRTVAGSMIFTVFDRNVLFSLLETTSYDSDDQFRSAIKDQLPPLDITITFANEYGALSRMGIYGVEFVTEQQVMSIEDLILEDVCQFVARDIDPMTPVLNDQGEPYNIILSNYNQAVMQGDRPTPISDLKASDLRGSDWDIKPGRESAAVDRFRRRNNPFF